MRDAEWIAQLLEHGLLSPSIPRASHRASSALVSAQRLPRQVRPAVFNGAEG